MKLNDAGKDELAIALILWRDFKSEGKFDHDIIIKMFAFADHLGIRKQLEDMISKLPPMTIVPRDQQM